MKTLLVFIFNLNFILCSCGDNKIEEKQKQKVTHSPETEPKVSAPGTIRGDYSHVSFKHSDAGPKFFNVIHGSATPEEAQQEIAVWFAPDELIDHEPAYTKHTVNK